jgi:hypothetical protein
MQMQMWLIRLTGWDIEMPERAEEMNILSPSPIEFPHSNEGASSLKITNS